MGMSKYRVCMGVEKNGVFVKVAVSRAIRLRECPLRELPMY